MFYAYSRLPGVIRDFANEGSHVYCDVTVMGNDVTIDFSARVQILFFCDLRG